MKYYVTHYTGDTKVITQQHSCPTIWDLPSPILPDYWGSAEHWNRSQSLAQVADWNIKLHQPLLTGNNSNKLTSFTMLSVDSQLLEATLSASMKKISLPGITMVSSLCQSGDEKDPNLVSRLHILQACKPSFPSTPALPGQLRPPWWCPSLCSPSSPGPDPAGSSPAVCPRRCPRCSSQTWGRWWRR